jgi:asparagine synthase (glutamine-hydrolysing)
MCGILGTINISERQGALDLIEHRGPDAYGEINRKVGSHLVYLGHRRLSIVDLSPAGNQPMLSQDGSKALVYNGEVYNHRDLRNQLGDVHFIGHSDTETILHLLSRQGLAAVPNLNGIFALAFLNISTYRLYLARDPFGVKPLYYCQEGNTFAFSSEIKPLVRLMRQTLSTDNLAELLRLRYSPSPDTLFNGIHKVRPGHIIEVDLSRDRIQITECTYLLPIPPVIQTLSAEVNQSDYGNFLRRAVERQLMSDVEVGIFLSGGVDSAVVAQLAQSSLPNKMKAFTVGFSETDESDEIAAAQETAAYIGLDHHTVRIGFDDFLNKLKECVLTVEEPLATTSIIPMYYLAELAAQHVKVVLSGQGADESLGGYRRYQGELLRRLTPPSVARLVNRLAICAGLQSESIMRGLPALAERDDIKRFALVYEVFSSEQVQDLVGVRDGRTEERIAYFYNLLGCSSLVNGTARMMSVDLRMNLTDDLLLYTDKITMKQSLECRVPMLDVELIRFIEALPVGHRVRFGDGKLIHKRLAETILPANILRRKKKGFTSPTRRWFREKTAIRDLLLSRNSAFARYFNRQAVDSVINQHDKGYNRERHIFLLLGIYYWLEEFA